VSTLRQVERTIRTTAAPRDVTVRLGHGPGRVHMTIAKIAYQNHELSLSSFPEVRHHLENPKIKQNSTDNMDQEACITSSTPGGLGLGLVNFSGVNHSG
jgi:hypothetical protein